jgi:Hemopexin
MYICWFLPSLHLTFQHIYVVLLMAWRRFFVLHSGDKYVQLEDDGKVRPGFPKLISHTFPGLPTHLDAVLSLEAHNGQLVYFFKVIKTLSNRYNFVPSTRECYCKLPVHTCECTSYRWRPCRNTLYPSVISVSLVILTSSHRTEMFST